MSLLTQEEKQKIKKNCWERIFQDPLMVGCREVRANHLRALFVGYWDFVDRFPAVIRESYEASGPFARFGKVLAGVLCEMENDERVHRDLWIRSAAAAGVKEAELYSAEPLPETVALIDAMLARKELWQRLLDFVAVEIVAEGISACLAESEQFTNLMGSKGMSWFKVHLVHDTGVTSHEDVAYRAADAMLRKSGRESSFELINQTVQETVDRFFAAGAASLKAHA